MTAHILSVQGGNSILWGAVFLSNLLKHPEATLPAVSPCSAPAVSGALRRLLLVVSLPAVQR